MRALILTSFALFGVAWTQTTSRPVEPCSMCEFVVNQAYSHFNKRESKWRVEEELLNDCNSLQRFYGFQAVRDCQGWIRTNIDVIYNDMENNKTPQQICTDMGECGATVKTTAVTAAASTITTTTTVLTTTTTTLTNTPVDLCALCIGVIDKARNSGVDVTDEAALLIELLGDCQALVPQYGQSVSTNCVQAVSQYIFQITTDLGNNASSQQVCKDMKQCL